MPAKWLNWYGNPAPNSIEILRARIKEAMEEIRAGYGKK